MHSDRSIKSALEDPAVLSVAQLAMCVCVRACVCSCLFCVFQFVCVCCCPLPDSPGTRLNQKARVQVLIHKLSGESGPQALILPGTRILVLKAVTWHPALEFRFVEF